MQGGRLQEYALVSDQMVKQWTMVAYESFRSSLIIHKDKTEEIIVLLMSVSVISDIDTAKLYIQFFISK